MTRNTEIWSATRTERALVSWTLCTALCALCACASDDGSNDQGVSAAAAGGSGGSAGTSPFGTAGTGGTGGIAGAGTSGMGGIAGSAAGAAGAGSAGIGGAGGIGGVGAAGAAGAAGMPGAGEGGQAGDSMMAGSGGEGGMSAGEGDAGGEGGGGEEETCPLPTTFKWTTGGPIAQPKNGWVSLKDFTHVIHDGKHVVYMTTHDQSNWGSAMFVFDDWPDAATAPQTGTSFGVAPTLFYFSSKDIWVIAYQWGPHKFSYRTSSNPSDPNGWSGEHSLYNTALPAGGTGPIDQTVICDATHCYLYYAGDNGHIYKSSMPIESFPSEFPAAQDSGIPGTTQNLFEGVQVYTVKGSDTYLMLVEAQGAGRYFRAWTATDLGGPWTLLTDAFASKNNVTFTSGAWTNDISHGDLIRTNPDETFTVDACNLQMIFQGRDPSINVSYGLLPYRPGLLTFEAP